MGMFFWPCGFLTPWEFSKREPVDQSRPSRSLGPWHGLLLQSVVLCNTMERILTLKSTVRFKFQLCQLLKFWPRSSYPTLWSWFSICQLSYDFVVTYKYNNGYKALAWGFMSSRHFKNVSSFYCGAINKYLVNSYKIPRLVSGKSWYTKYYKEVALYTK